MRNPNSEIHQGLLVQPCRHGPEISLEGLRTQGIAQDACGAGKLLLNRKRRPEKTRNGAVLLERQIREQGEVFRVRIDWRDFLPRDRKSTRLNSSHVSISYAVFCLKKK